jgi:putative DNA primase/helicase
VTTNPLIPRDENIRLEDFQTDASNARHVAEQFHNEIRYTYDTQTWYWWTGQYWLSGHAAEDMIAHTIVFTVLPRLRAQVEQEIKDTTKRMLDGELDQDAAEKILKGLEAHLGWYMRSEGARIVASTMDSLRTVPAGISVHSKVFDNQPWLFNVLNGTLDLRSGKLREPLREDYLTKQGQVNYDPLATCPKFDAFMDSVFQSSKDDGALKEFVMRAMGYTLTGDISEQCLFICHGTNASKNGANGKSTLIDLMKLIHGPSAYAARQTTFTTGKFQDPKYELANLRAMRLVTCIEPLAEGRLDEETIKNLTGDAEFTARQIRQEPITFSVTFKIWMAFNNTPRIKGTDQGIWRRVMLIPFPIQIPEPRIRDYYRVLYQEEASGILNCMLDGLADYVQGGLNPPQAVRAAIAEYRDSQNTVQQWIFDRALISKPALTAYVSALYNDYKSWCEERGEYADKLRNFSTKLEQLGYTKRRDNSGIYFTGIALLTTDLGNQEGGPEGQIPFETMQ